MGVGVRSLSPRRDARTSHRCVGGCVRAWCGVISVNGDPVDADSKTITEVLAMLSIETRGVAVARNGEVVPRSSWSDVTLDEGDRIEIVTAAAGG